LLCIYGNSNEPLFGIRPLYDLKIKNVTEWESKSPHGLIVEDGYQDDRKFYLKCDEDAGGWLKALLRASCWDDGRSRMNILGTLTKIKKLTASKAGEAASPRTSPQVKMSSKSRSSAPPLSLKSMKVTQEQQQRRVEPASLGAGAGVRRRPSNYANPFSGGSGGRENDSPVMFGKKNRRTVASPAPPPPAPTAAPASSIEPSPSNPFDSSDDEGDYDDDDDDEILPPPPSLNPFRSSCGAPEELEEEIDTSQSTDDFLSLSENGVINYKRFLAWDEVQSAIETGDISEDEISVLWLEVAGGGDSVDQEQFTKLVGKLEARLL
jgi:hypothetical protein